MRYNLKRNKLSLYKGASNIPSKPYTVLDSEKSLVSDFVDSYSNLKEIDRKKIAKMRNNNTLYRCWYYCKVWELTTTNLTINQSNKRGGLFSVDHIYPISLGLKNEVPYWLIASKENLQVIKSMDNIRKGVNLTSKGIELFNKFQKQ